MSGEPGTRAWMCLVCGWMYYEALGVPEEGIAPGTPWEEVPDDWKCPDCGTEKADFVMVPL
ncbi:MAG TPA: rubredoxin [Micromonospora sp.]